MKDGSSDENVSTNQLIVQFFCAPSTLHLAKQYRSEIAESISGPISNDQASGIVDAIDSVRPPATVSLPMTLAGSYGGNLTWELTGITYKVTTYSVWVTTQPSPSAEQRVGYIVVSVPTKLQLGRTFQDLAGAFCPAIGDVKLGAGFGSASGSASGSGRGPLAPPDGGFAPILTYGRVRVLSGGSVSAAADVRPGENATFLLPPGAYSAVADVVLFGIPFSVGSGTYSSPQGATMAQFTVSLPSSVEDLWYGLEAAAVIVLVAVILIIARKWHLWAVVVRASMRLSHILRSAWDALLRASQGELPGRANTLIGLHLGRSEQGREIG